MFRSWLNKNSKLNHHIDYKLYIAALSSENQLNIK